ncbi:hypothetical protein ACE6H2_028433 [Prunus campanulata]
MGLSLNTIKISEGLCSCRIVPKLESGEYFLFFCLPFLSLYFFWVDKSKSRKVRVSSQMRHLA